MKSPYFKAVRDLHETGFRYIEYGYCNIDKKSKATDIEVVGRYDCLFCDDMKLHIDCTRDGYIRVLNPVFKWDKVIFSGRLIKDDRP